MVLEWIRRHDPSFDAKLREYLFTEGSIVGREEAVGKRELSTNGANGARITPPLLTLGSLRGGR